MATKASEISELIKQQIKNFEHEAKSSDVGKKKSKLELFLLFLSSFPN